MSIPVMLRSRSPWESPWIDVRKSKEIAIYGATKSALFRVFQDLNEVEFRGSGRIQLNGVKRVKIIYVSGKTPVDIQLE